MKGNLRKRQLVRISYKFKTRVLERLNESKSSTVLMPDKFMFQLSSDGMEILRSQFATPGGSG